MSWPIVSLGEIATKIGSGATPRGGSKAYKLKGTPLVRSMNVHDGVFQPHGLAFIDDKQAMALDNVILSGGDVLLNITGASVARCCRLPSNYAGGRVNQHVAIIRPKTDVIRSDYLEQLLTSPDTKRQLLGIAGGGATREAITKAAIENFEIPLPPLEEQKRIAAILDQADALRRLRTRALDKLNTLGQAIFHEMFEGGVRPSTIEDLLKDKTLLVHKDGNHGSNYPRKEEFGETGVPFFSAKAIDENGNLIKDSVEFLSEDKAKSLKIGWISGGDVLLSHNASVGKVARYDGLFGDALIGTSLTCFRPNPTKLKSGFLEFALKSYAFQEQLKANMSQTTRNQVPITAQKRLRLTIPSLDEQIAFETKARDVVSALAMANRAFTQSETLFFSLQHRAFRGEL